MKTRQDPARSGITRRELLLKMGSGLVALTVSSSWGEITPAQARAARLALRNLSVAEGRTLEAWGDVLLPGAREAGITNYVDDQLSRDNPSFILKYLDYVGSYLKFYRQGLHSLERYSRTRYGRSFARLTSEQQVDLVRALSQQSPRGWSGPPAPLLYFVTRNDAVDVYYGTVEGFAKLDIPYMAQLLPPAKW